MTWVRLDDGFLENPKIGALTDRELRIWISTLCYCGRQEDPTVDRLTMRSVRGLTPKFIAKCIALSLLDEAKNSYEIHDWILYQPKDKTAAERQARYRSRRLEQAKPLRYDTVTPTVTESVTPDRNIDRNESVTPVPVPQPDPSSSSESVSDLPPSSNESELPNGDIDFSANGQPEDADRVRHVLEEGGISL